jgi:hypothetical protein
MPYVDIPPGFREAYLRYAEDMRNLEIQLARGFFHKSQLIGMDFVQSAQDFVAEEERKGLPKKSRHHDHLLNNRHIRSVQRK